MLKLEYSRSNFDAVCSFSKHEINRGITIPKYFCRYENSVTLDLESYAFFFDEPPYKPVR